jgi:hypothetical protein
MALNEPREHGRNPAGYRRHGSVSDPGRLATRLAPGARGAYHRSPWRKNNQTP